MTRRLLTNSFALIIAGLAVASLEAVDDGWVTFDLPARSAMTLFAE